MNPTRRQALLTMCYVEGWLSFQFPEASKYLMAQMDEIADQMVEDECAEGDA